MATVPDPQWKDQRVISNEARDRAFGRLKTEPSTSSAQERPSKPKSTLLDFDESADESIEQKDKLDDTEQVIN